MLVLAIGVVTSFTSCGDDDKDTIVPEKKCECGGDCHGTKCSAPCADDCKCSQTVSSKFRPSRVFTAGLLKSYCGDDISYNSDNLVSRIGDYSITYLSYDKDGYDVMFIDKENSKSKQYKCKIGDNKFFSDIDWYDSNNTLVGRIKLNYDTEGHLTDYYETRYNNDGSTRKTLEVSFAWNNGDIVQTKYSESGYETETRDITYSTDVNIGGIMMFETFYGDCDIDIFYLCGGAGIATKHLPIVSECKYMIIKDVEWVKDSKGRAVKCSYKCHEDVDINGGFVEDYTREFVWQ